MRVTVIQYLKYRHHIQECCLRPYIDSNPMDDRANLIFVIRCSPTALESLFFFVMNFQYLCTIVRWRNEPTVNRILCPAVQISLMLDSLVYPLLLTTATRPGLAV